MEKYNLEQTGQEVQNILNEATPQSELTAETERAQEAERLLGEGIQQNATDIDSIDGKIPSAASSENKLTDKAYVDGLVDDEKNRAQGVEDTLQDNIDAEETRAKAAEKQNSDDIDALEAVVPSGATSENKLATESYVNDAVATSSATFRGTYNLVSDLHLTLEATHANIATALAAAIATADNNDFAFVLIPTDAETPTVIGSIERYKFNGTDWAYEYTLNNSGFTQAQWAAINSGITSGDVAKLAALPTNAQLTTLLAGLQSDIDGEEARAKGAEGTLQDNIDAEEARAKAAEKQNADDIDAIEAVIPESASSENKVATESEINSLSAAIEAILLLIPSAATSLNKLADKAFVNSSIATATATFRGTYNLVDDLGLTTSATHAQISTALGGAILTANNNDYAFVQIPTSTAMPTEIAKTERYKFNGTAWEYEYDLNNSGFTADQWAAINSGITQALVTKLSALPTNAQLTTELGTLTSGITTINQKIPNAASQANKLVDTAAMESYIVEVLNVLTISYNVTSTDGHVTFHIEQVDGKITSVTLATSDIASAAALNLKASQADLTALEGRVTTAEGNITTLNGNLTSLTGRVSTNETDIAQLQDAYEALTQSDIIIGALPASGVANKIYRVPGTSSYSDYMWNGSTWVLMATYNNAIDPRPKKASQNLVTSGGVFDNMGALDVSELNATENPHTLAQYVDLSAALAAIPTDYQKGGMSIKYVRSSDNKYVQACCMAQNFTTDITQWQGVDDKPTAGSGNLVKSGGIKEALNTLGQDMLGISDEVLDYPLKDYALSASGKFGPNATSKHAALPVYEGEVYYLICSSVSCRYAYATSDVAVESGDIPVVSGTDVEELGVGEYSKLVIPEGCTYLLFNTYVAQIGDMEVQCYRHFDKINGAADDEPILGSEKIVKSGGVALTNIQVDNVVEENNMFWGEDGGDAGITWEWKDFGLKIVGTTTAAVRIPLRGSVNYKDANFSKGDYIATFFLDGTISDTSNVSLRYDSDVRWVNSANTSVSVEFSKPTNVFFYVANNTTLNIALRIQINKGTTASEWIVGGISALDKEARKEIISINEQLTEQSSLNLTRAKVLNSDHNAVVETNNLFWGLDDTINGVTFSWTDDGLVISGTASRGTYLYLHNSKVLDNSDSIFPAGTYTASLAMTGTLTNETGLSLRYGSGTRWVNKNVSNETVTFASDTLVYLQIAANNQVNVTLKIQINKGDTASAWAASKATAVDSAFRNMLPGINRSSLPLNVSDFETELVNNALVTLNNMASTDDDENLVVSYITDTHIDKYQTGRHGEESFKLFSALTSNFGQFSVHLGDIVQCTSRTVPEALNNIFNVLDYLRYASNYVLVRGNHDTNIRPLNPVQKTLFTGMFKDNGNVRIVHNENDPNSLYGYFDLPQFKCRVYVVDAYDALTTSIMEEISNDIPVISTTQLTWLFDNNAITENGWTALVCAHCKITNIFTINELPEQSVVAYTAIRKTIYDNLLSNGIPVVWINGNNHEDTYLKVECATSDGGASAYLLDINFENAFYTDSGTDKPTTESEKYCLGFITLDTSGNKIYDTRIGRGSSRAWHYGLSKNDIYELTELL